MSPLGDTAVILEAGKDINEETHRRVHALSSYLEENPFPGLIEIVPAFTTVTIYYDPAVICNAPTVATQRNGAGSRPAPYQMVCSYLSQACNRLGRIGTYQPRTVEIPVCYGGEWGPDLTEVAHQNSLTPDEVVEIHTQPDYLVYMIGFAPGFPYLGGLSEQISTPRKSSPRLSIPAGSVGIAGSQTGIYPISTPGGWQIIGRTPLALFRPVENPPSLLQAGDMVRFRAISPEEFKNWKGETA
ncbi:5-oxoprolinase subunit PxpB [Paenactinomyces guangxiensis]|uniref:5-oxoprolinase subunit PxpB n=1 Tax=Paenactinomyces guangxiensis TaxID=1490290 RepID=A0A7W2AAC6_9BACL|nr:5-oxoprolinase subunit PxpB [Paenactinomyces guangxiensis]MBA4496127.1 5-oxoprolinase subunit PxpB [Paenactinomyces guangxiensis]MBH8593215.1 5-oxoprolinase subunit PxpB [Paenactinomyces guangxiensis]